MVRPSGPVFDMGGRSVETIQTVYFKNDSIKLTLYDNGEVDGDTVSVVLNGKMIMSKKGSQHQCHNSNRYICCPKWAILFR
ncbi:MAG: hypothetical protein V9E88_10745 [Ferruginibacter sp.]